MISIIFFLIFIPILAFILLYLNFFLAPHRPYKEKKTPFECGYHSFITQNRTPFTVSFYIFAMLFLLFDIEITTVFPFVVSSNFNGPYGFSIVIVFILILTLGFVFEIGKNALKIDTKQDKSFLLSLFLINTSQIKTSNFIYYIITLFIMFICIKIPFSLISHLLTDNYWIIIPLLTGSSVFLNRTILNGFLGKEENINITIMSVYLGFVFSVIAVYISLEFNCSYITTILFYIINIFGFFPYLWFYILRDAYVFMNVSDTGYGASGGAPGPSGSGGGPSGPNPPEKPLNTDILDNSKSKKKVGT